MSMDATPKWKLEMDRPRLKSLMDLFHVQKPVIGMVHLWPLPGAPGYSGYGMRAILDHGLRDVETLVKGGVDGLIVENMLNIAYYVGTVVMQKEESKHATT